MGTLLDMPIATNALDSSGEVLSIENVDISDFHSGKAFANWEHQPTQHADNIVGYFKYAKKILKKEDCTTDRQKMYWDKLKHPFIYGICELFDDEEHAGGLAIAAMVNYFVKRDLKVEIGASIEGITLERDEGNLLRAIARGCAITLRPANKECWVDMASEDTLKEVIKKSETIRLSKTETVEVTPFILSKSDIPVYELIAGIKEDVENLNKTLTAGGGDVAPSSLTGGAALAVEDKSMHNRVKAALRDWNKKRPLKEVIKAALPEVSDSFVDHFTQVAEDLTLKKGEELPVKMSPIRIASETHPSVQNGDEAQSSLINGLYMTPNMMSDVKSRHQLINDSGDTVKLHTPHMRPDNMCSAAASTAYHKIAKDIFGLADNVPVTNYFDWQNPNGGESQRWQVSQHDDRQPLISQEVHNKAMDANKKNGNLYKMAIMDFILGVNDRSKLDMAVNSKGNLQNIDNGGAFSYNTGGTNMYSSIIDQGVMPTDIYQWLQKIDPKQLAQQMLSHMLLPEQIKKAIYNLRYLQKHGVNHPLEHILSPKVEENVN